MTDLNDLKVKAIKIDNILLSVYGEPKRSGPGKLSPLDELVLTILSQNTTDKNSFKAFKNLKAKYPDWISIHRTPVTEIAELIKIGGLGKIKAGYIMNCLDWIKKYNDDYDLSFICEMDTDEAMDYLTSIDGVGVKTAAVTLAFSCGKDLYPVDTHVFRVSGRLGFLEGISNPEKAFYFMRKIIPQGRGFGMHMNIIRHGREVCHARKPDCFDCHLKELCIYDNKNLNSD